MNRINSFIYIISLNKLDYKSKMHRSFNFSLYFSDKYCLIEIKADIIQKEQDYSQKMIIRLMKNNNELRIENKQTRLLLMRLFNKFNEKNTQYYLYINEWGSIKLRKENINLKRQIFRQRQEIIKNELKEKLPKIIYQILDIKQQTKLLLFNQKYKELQLQDHNYDQKYKEHQLKDHKYFKNYNFSQQQQYRIQKLLQVYGIKSYDSNYRAKAQQINKIEVVDQYFQYFATPNFRQNDKIQVVNQEKFIQNSYEKKIYNFDMQFDHGQQYKMNRNIIIIGRQPYRKLLSSNDRYQQILTNIKFIQGDENISQKKIYKISNDQKLHSQLNFKPVILKNIFNYDQFHYQKQILSYIPKFNHIPSLYYSRQIPSTIILQSQSNQSLPTYISKNINTISLITKLFIIQQIIISLIFLQYYSITYIPSNPQNILIYQQLIVKIIDFTQAYHPDLKNKSIQIDQKQDVLIIGILLQLILFQPQIFEQNEKKYNKKYNNKFRNIQFNKKYREKLNQHRPPQKYRYYGPGKLMYKLAHLTIKCTHSNPLLRPSLKHIYFSINQTIEYIKQKY